MSILQEIIRNEDLLLDEVKQTGTSKLQVHPYAKDYERILKPFRSMTDLRLVEIGCYHGASLILWHKYFPTAKITMVDIELRNSVKNVEGRVDPKLCEIVVGNGYTEQISHRFSEIDIAIDDGSHLLPDMLKFVELYYPKLAPGGILVVEDIMESYWMLEMAKLVPRCELIDYQKSGLGQRDSRMFIAYK